ncbi:MAG: NACHT domain-containing protein, partial [Dehalococcoidia bacterium]
MILLADSGMGKTSALLNYYARNQRRLWGRHRIAITPMRGDTDRYIESIDRKPETVMFLDGFDEDPRAIEDYQNRLRELLDLCRDFRRVIITSRTQFFPNDEEVPLKTGISRKGPTDVGQGWEYELAKLYLVPLSPTQEREFIRKRYPFWRQLSRAKMRRLVRSIPDLTSRPMLLAAIPEFINRKDLVFNNSVDLYEALIEGWIQREYYWVPSDAMRDFSSRLAFYLYVNRQDRGREIISQEEIETLARQWGIDVDSWKFTGRSLLNRDAAGNYRFGHRTIMEYLVVKRLLSGAAETYDLKLTDQMEQFFGTMLTNHSNWRESFGALE